MVTIYQGKRQPELVHDRNIVDVLTSDAHALLWRPGDEITPFGINLPTRDERLVGEGECFYEIDVTQKRVFRYPAGIREGDKITRDEHQFIVEGELAEMLDQFRDAGYTVHERERMLEDDISF